MPPRNRYAFQISTQRFRDSVVLDSSDGRWISCLVRQSRWKLVEPRLRTFELPRKAEKSRLCAKTRCELHPDGEHLLVPVKWNGHRRLAGHVEYRSIRHEVECLVCESIDDVKRLHDPCRAEPALYADYPAFSFRYLKRSYGYGWLRERWCEKYVVVLKEPGDFP